MTSEEVIGTIMTMVQEYFVFMLPVIGVMAGIVFIISFLFSVTLGASKHIFKG